MTTKEVMSETTRVRKTHERLAEAVADWENQAKAGNVPGEGGEWEIACIERETVTTITLELGGPTTYVEFHHSGDDVTECRFWTTAFSDSHNSHRSVFADVGADRGQELFELLRLGQ